MVTWVFTDIFLRICSVRWKGIDGQYSTGFGYVSHAKQALLVLICVCSRSSPSVKRNEQDQTFVAFYLSCFVAETDGIL
jgi:hypothetical protein